MASELLRKQWIFARAVAELIIYATELGYDVTLGHALRCPDCRTGAGKSLHKERLAIDLMLFRDGVYLKKTEDYRELGEWWETTYAHMSSAWGGRFKHQDGNHFSFTWQGRK